MVRPRPLASASFNYAMAVLGLLFIGGLYLDGWAHNHHRVDRTFFTPWHAVFYSGFALLALFTLAALLRNRRAGYPWNSALPSAYAWTLAGIVIFLASGIGDMIWHWLFGIEASVAALLSPTHLGLAVGGALIVTGPFRAAAESAGSEPASWRTQGPAVISLLCMYSILTFMTQYASPLFEYGVAPGPPARYFEIIESRGVISQLLDSAIMTGMLLLMVRTWGAAMPRGAVTALLLPNAALMATQSDEYRFLWAVAATSVIGDILVSTWRPSPDRVRQLRAFAFAIPALYWLGHYLTYFAAHLRLYYPVHVWTGCIVVSGIIGLLLSFLVSDRQAPSSRRSAEG